MAFVPKSFDQILISMISHVRANTTITDFTVGSVARTLLEACALEDDEQYYQMVQLLDAFRIATARGSDLDERGADLNLDRLQTASSFGKVRITNGGLTTDELAFNYSTGDGLIILADSSSFTTSTPFDIRIGEGTSQVEDITVVTHTPATNMFTFGVATLANDHSIGERVSEITGSDVTIPRGVQVQVAATINNLPIAFTTVEIGTITSGNYESGLIDIISVSEGADSNIPAGRISQFSSSPPFAGAGVTNPTATSGGRNVESDLVYRDRLLRRFDLLSRGVPMAVEEAVIGVEDLTTGKRVVTSKLRESFATDDHILFVDDGSGLVPDETIMASTTLTANAPAGTTTLQVDDASVFPTSGSLIISPGITGSVEVIGFNSTGPGNVITLEGTGAVNGHLSGEEVLLVEIVEDSAESGQNFFDLIKWPIKENSFEIYHNSTGEFILQTSGTDYYLNRSNGELELLGAGLPAGTAVVSNYSYRTGLLHEVQRVLNGDETDPTNYPGVVAGGVIVNVDVPNLRTISVTISISVKAGYDESEVALEVETVVSGYIDGLNIGENIIRAEIVASAMAVVGVANAILQNPTSDIVILEDELPVSYDSSGVSLITVL